MGLDEESENILLHLTKDFTNQRRLKEKRVAAYLLEEMKIRIERQL